MSELNNLGMDLKKILGHIRIIWNNFEILDAPKMVQLNSKNMCEVPTFSSGPQGAKKGLDNRACLGL